MTAVELLKFMKTKFFTDMVEIFGNVSYQEIFEKYEPQEILERIEKYEAEKKCDFKVGDLVQCVSTGDVGKITKIFLQKQVMFNDKWAEISDVEHAEPPKEEKKCSTCKHDVDMSKTTKCKMCYQKDCFESKEENQKIEKIYFATASKMISDKTVRDLERLKTSAIMRDNKSAKEIVNNAIETIEELEYLYFKAVHDLREKVKSKDRELEQVRLEREKAFEQLKKNGLRFGDKDDYGWVDCDDRLPDKPLFREDGYIVQTSDIVEPFSAYWNGAWFIDGNNDIIPKVIAWRNLPVPYGILANIQEELLRRREKETENK